MAEERKYWNPEIETMPLDKLRKLQEERLRERVAWAYKRTKLYRRKFDEAGVKPGDIKTLEDITKLPLTDDVIDIRGKPLSDKLAIPQEEIKMFHSTSGTTTGIPEAIPFSEKDKEIFFDQGEARCRWTMGARPWDVVQVLTRFDCCFLGYRQLGATMVMLSAGRYDLDKQISLTKTAGVTIIEHMPSLVLKYFERAKELGFDIKKESKLRLISGVGEAWAESYKRKVEAQYGLPFMTLWGSVELGAGAAECEQRRGGMHIFSDLFLLEILDPETHVPLPDGEEGEVVVTPLLNEAMPLIRYRMGDVAKVLPYQPCSCGRTLPKMSMVKGRISQIVNVKGKKILPLDIEEVMASTEGLADNYQIVVDKPGELERLKMKMEYRPEVKELGALKSRVERAVHQQLGVESEVELVPSGAISSATYKAQRVVKTY